MRLTTETAVGQMIFKSAEDAEAFIAGMADLADADETFEVQPYQGGRYHVARFYKGAFETFC